ncbi:hypothetical protein KPL70_021991 [Citrus sinensis]|uniref:fasciclin-like arabinogalactan protein 21 n=1 Tax=Citrus sinensis TaxID=2711 RepID=UPI0003D75FE7|nr:fasciclin-like arabinogalactan protein 21 [Citrus sinensis]XP_024036525.1 fasciclin-like arabinogalactan protein 21 [Citrus x clementina]KAH9669933.1 hypothetical protein KPL70_021991 [Citrus sinensis]
MATLSTSLRFLTILAIYLLIITKSAALTDVETLFTTTPPPQQTPPPPSDLNDQSSFFSHTAMLAPILSHLGFNELATGAPSLSNDAVATSWSGPSTLFAPSDSSLHTCFSCSVPSLLREHLVPGLFTIDYLRKLAFGTKIESLSPGRCITITSSKSENDTVSKVFIGGVEITHPDLFNNGIIIIHGIQGYISPLSPLSCDVERMTSLSFPFQPSDRGHHHQQIQTQQPIMRLMLRDAMLRLRNNGYSILSLAMKVKYQELINLANMTVFALDDVSIFSGSYTYISNVRFHIIPNRYLTIGDLERLPVGTTLPTLARGQSLTVTTAGGASVTAPLRINYVRVKVPDVMKNLKIVVHGIYLPFPHLHPATVFDGVIGVSGNADGGSDGGDPSIEGECSVMDEHGIGSCGGTVTGPATTVASGAKFSKPTVEIEDHHML